MILLSSKASWSRKPELIANAVFVAVLSFTQILAAIANTDSNPALANSASPYLREHATDLIRWHPLTKAVLDQAQAAGKPILVSSGYLSCYWCFRLKKDTWSNAQLAALVNRKFLPVLIDREVHIAEDTYLQRFLQKHQNFSGWPASIILTPEGIPVFGYSYIDPETLIRSLQTFLSEWDKQPGAIVKSAKEQEENTARVKIKSNQLIEEDSTETLLRAFLDQANAAADAEHGGFGIGEKYPFLPQLLSLIDILTLYPNQAAISFVQHTLDNILESAIIDHVHSGVFRYTEEADWREPHFEQMLYTQALMVQLLSRSATLTGNRVYALQAVRIAEQMVKRFRDKDGWYISSLSAVSEAGEDGAYYLWNTRELEAVLGPAWHGRITNLSGNHDEILPKIRNRIDSVTVNALRNYRSKTTIQNDGKKLVAWNGLVLSALATTSPFNPGLQQAASALAENLQNLIASGALPLLANVDATTHPADLATYTYVAQSLFDWWQLSGDPGALGIAEGLLKVADEAFHHDGMWITNHQQLIGPQESFVSIADSQLPSPSALWIKMAQAITLARPADAKVLENSLKEKMLLFSKDMLDEAFFHGTVISAHATRQWLNTSGSALPPARP